MPTWAKVLLGLIAAGVLLIGAVIVVGAMWVRNNKDALIKQAREAAAEGEAFGQGKVSDRCIEEGLAQVGRCDGITCEVRTQLFLKACLVASDIPKGFCDGVPVRSEIMDSVKWTLRTCQARGASTDAQKCQRLFAAWQDHCHPED